MHKFAQHLLQALHLRLWMTPLCIGSLILMSATGVLMFFELESLGLITVVHQWFSLLFLIAIAGHIYVNFFPFKRHLKTPMGKVNVLIFTTIFVISLFSWGMITGPQLERPIEHALVNAPLSALARIAQINTNTLMQRLKTRGFLAIGKQSIHDVAVRYEVDENQLLAIVFLPER